MTEAPVDGPLLSVACVLMAEGPRPNHGDYHTC
jgi:hypothetical protein